tara:strand:- start:25009 stop:27360 length:2352 start_codon:yes stop_codon:yes gene_type:complete
MSKKLAILLISTAGCSIALGQDTYQLDEASPSGDVEYSTTGKVNWKPTSPSGPWASGVSELFDGYTPDQQPYGDVLSYTGAGVGDVDNDGYGDFAITWYHAEVSAYRSEAFSTEPDHTTFSGSGDSVGFVRVISGNPNYLNTGGIHSIDSGGPTTNVVGGSTNEDMRRIGPDFWGKHSGAIWSHEITTIGDIDGDSKDEVVLASNYSGGGIVEIWACTARYNTNPLTPQRWVKLLEIEGELGGEEIGYQSYHGPLPSDYTSGSGTSGYDLDFNDDGAPDLLLASKWSRDADLGHAENGTTGRSRPPGAAWLFLMPKADVFDEIAAKRLKFCDNLSNADGSVGSDGIPDVLPLKISSEEYNLRITGHQIAAWDGTDQASSGTNCAPRYFGADIDPAGDLDDDGLLDIVVGAPGNIANADYAADPSDYVTTDAPGQIYFFLSGSTNENRPVDGEDVITFADSLPKHYTSTSQLVGVNCDSGLGTVFSTTYRVRSKSQMTALQLDFTSEAADFVITGGTTYSGRSGIGNHIEGGVKLDKNSDPDFAFHHQNDLEVLVMLDMQTRITDWINHVDGGNGSHPTTTQNLWTIGQSETTTLFKPDIGIRRYSGSEADTYLSWNTVTPAEAGVTGFRIAGNFDGSSYPDCELAIDCSDGYDNRQKSIKIVEITPTGVGSSIIANIWPESSGIDFTGESQLSPGFDLYHIYDGNITAWPIWPGSLDDQYHDLLIGARTYPVQVTTVRQADGTVESIEPWDSGMSLTQTQYNRRTTVGAGRAWVLRAKEAAKP